MSYQPGSSRPHGREATPPPSQPSESSPASQLSHPATITSTPATRRGGSKTEELSNVRAKDLLSTLHAGHHIWNERIVDPSRTSMLDQFVMHMDEQYRMLAESAAKDIPAVQNFLRTEGKGKANEVEFSLMVEEVTRRLAACADIPQSDKRYVRSGARPMQYRACRQRWMKDEEPVNKSLGLKPDFFTSRVRRNDVTKEWRPVSLSTVLHNMDGLEMAAAPTTPSVPPVTESSRPRRSGRSVSHSPSASVSAGISEESNSSCLTNSGIFTWDDVQLLWEIKSSSDEINNSKVLSNLILKATEVLRAQWHRRFVLAFLVCGKLIKMLRFDRSGVLNGCPVNIAADNGKLLVKCILAGLVLSPPDLGLPRELENPKITLVDNVPRLVITVGEKEFVLGEQIFGPPRDHLVGRGTVVHLARRIDGDEWDVCYKAAWPYATRPHEGSVLEELQGVEGVVELFAWDAPKFDGMLGKAEIHRDFQVSAKASSRLMATSINGEGQQTTSTLTSNDAGDETTDNNFHDFHPREFRQTVTAYIPESFSKDLSPLDLLSAWRSLYLVVDAIAKKGWVHRDLSWSNVRITRHKKNTYDTVSVVLVDFDLASPIDGPASGSPDRTGTVAFMPIETLTPSSAFRHHGLHEDEAAFWIGFLASIAHTYPGRRQFNRLSSPRLELEVVAREKRSMVSVYDRKTFWKEWFGEKKDREELRKICERVLMTQFTLEVDMAYPLIEENDEGGRKKHEVMHERVVGEVVQVLEEGIEQLRQVREAGSDRGLDGDKKKNLVERVGELRLD